MTYMSGEHLCSIKCNSEDGIISPKYGTQLPSPLSEAGITSAQWTAFLSQANDAVAFDWGKFCTYSLGPLCCFCCFFCNLHNRSVRNTMENFCETTNAAGTALPNIIITSEWKTEVQISRVEHGHGSSLASFHFLHFHTKEDVHVD